MKNYLAKFNSLNAYKNFITDSDEYVYPSVSVINNDDIRYNNIDYSEVVVTEESNEVLFNILNDNEIPYSNEDGYTVYDSSEPPSGTVSLYNLNFALESLVWFSG